MPEDSSTPPDSAPDAATDPAPADDSTFSGSKSFLQSKTIAGAVGIVVVYAMHSLGHNVTDADSAQISDAIEKALGLASLILVIVGRFRATKKITVSPPAAGAALFALVLGGVFALLLAGCANNPNAPRLSEVDLGGTYEPTTDQAGGQIAFKLAPPAGYRK